ncbi:MAG: hypothetical protein U0R76_10690 [Candidatus Nanopelagicales bacterium]
MSTTYKAKAVRWKHGWELHVDGVGVTQVRTLAAAEQQVRDLVETMLDVDASDAHVEVDVDGVQARVRRTKAKANLAATLQRAAAVEARTEAQDLRLAGLSVSDIAVIMHVSRGRVSQLLAEGATGEDDAIDEEARELVDAWFARAEHDEPAPPAMA